MPTRLSAHFSLEELTHSDTAVRLGITNVPTNTILENLTFLADKLEQVRAILDRQMIISSGYRCRELNARIGGAQTSAHVNGLAADFTAPHPGRVTGCMCQPSGWPAQSWRSTNCYTFV